MFESYRLGGVKNYVELIFKDKEPFAEIHQGDCGTFFGFRTPVSKVTNVVIRGRTVCEVKQELLV
ncbi:hypothetical protein SCBWM1_gp71 [Synechococcus phage S-CBWM1]|uniref:Uncharacterized protein n=1 Tax=Synechococcus phage S-CBWM1 TaxID=2053653 RepID=A0A3G1L3J7_9CAUD|nr:hypothetical protein HOU61_gp126 [Synechococcus phage S-CBWM1]ATW62755.1 hypothetical protein SCBWM1_gp71 [Synechococcus phage S-CBWM1]